MIRKIVKGDSIDISLKTDLMKLGKYLVDVRIEGPGGKIESHQYSVQIIKPMERIK